MATLVFLLEEESAKYMLQGLLTRQLPNFEKIHYFCFQGKQDLEKNIYLKIQYWQTPNTTFIILRDQDSADCIAVKENINSLVEKIDNPNVQKIIVRIACHELENFYLGDLSAIEQAFNISGLSKKQNQNKYRTPDNLSNAKQELKNLTKNEYQQISGSRKISSYMTLNGNRSYSFNVLMKSIFQDNLILE